MAKAKLESSFKLSEIGREFADVKTNMEDNLVALNNAFDAAIERWHDKNASTCADALSRHNSEMRTALEKLGRINSAIARMSELAAMYEDI